VTPDRERGRQVREEREIGDLHILRVDVEVLGEEEPEPGRVEVGAGPDDAAGREARQLPGDVGEDVDGVGDDEQQRLGRVLRQWRHDLPEQRDVPLEQVEARLPRARPRGDDSKSSISPWSLSGTASTSAISSARSCVRMVYVMAMPTHCEGRGGGGWQDWEGRRAVDLQRSLKGEKKGKGGELRLRGGEMGARVSRAT
jgi:hypothetical protein